MHRVGAMSDACVTRHRPAEPGAWRDRAVLALVVAGTIVLLVGSLSVWVRRQALETDYVVGASGRMLEDPEIRNAVSLYLVDELYRLVDVQGEIESILPARAQGLAGVAALALREAAPRAAAQILGSRMVIRAWKLAVGRAHHDFLRLVRGDFDKELDVYLRLRPLLVALATEVGIDPKLVAKLPADAARVPVLQKDKLRQLRLAVNALKSISVYGMLGVVVLYALALRLARGRRRETLFRIGLAVLVTGVVILIVRTLSGTALTNAVADSQPAFESAGGHAWRIVTEPLASTGWMAIVTGLVAMGLALLAGPSRTATRVRTALVPALVRSPAIAWTAVGVAIVAVLLAFPAIDATRVISRSVLILVLIGGTEMVRRVARDEQLEPVG
jgi:hypothetical protein